MVFLFRENKFSQNVNEIKKAKEEEKKKLSLVWVIGGVRKERKKTEK